MKEKSLPEFWFLEDLNIVVLGLDTPLLTLTGA